MEKKREWGEGENLEEYKILKSRDSYMFEIRQW